MAGEGMRIDQWLWFARLCKSRSLAQKMIAQGLVRLNRQAVEKAGALLRPGDEVALPQGRQQLRLRVLALAERRGPAAAAVQLYLLLDRLPRDDDV